MADPKQFTLTITMTPLMKALITLACVLVVFMLQADICTPSSNQTEQNSQSSQQDIYNQAQPIHQYPYSNYRQTLIQIEDQLATGDIATWTTASSYGIPLWVCKSLGWPIPVTAQLTNPQQVTTLQNGSTPVTVGQMDPSGIYPPPQSDGTWTTCTDSAGVVHPAYIEDKVDAYSFPVTLENGHFVYHPDQADPKSAIKPCKYNATQKKCE